jgi:ankyrin repeat protein
MYAAFEGHSEIVHTLLSAGARVNAVNSDGRTALGDAMMNCHAEVAAMLREVGAFGIINPQGFEDV